MWYGTMWWVLPLVIFLLIRGGPRRWHRRREMMGHERGAVSELRQVVEEQRSYIEHLEERLARVEDGLEFAERLLADRGVAAGGQSAG